MCELLGLNFNLKVDPNISFKVFRTHGVDNPDGWGVGFYNGKASIVYKEPINSKESILNNFLTNNKLLISNIFIFHVRRISIGEQLYENTHPFEMNYSGKNYLLAHNGTLNKIKKIKIDRAFKPIGDTDSEMLLSIILTFIKVNKIRDWDYKSFNMLYDLLLEINSNGALNLLFSDGEFLFTYFDKNAYNGLFYLERKSPFDCIRLKDIEMEVNLKYSKAEKQRGYIIATRPLTNENWIKYKSSQMIIFNKGDIIYNSEVKK